MSKIIAFAVAVAAMCGAAYVAPAHAAGAGSTHVERLYAEAEKVATMDVHAYKAWRLRWADRISKERNEHNRYSLSLDLVSIVESAAEIKAEQAR